MPAARFTRSTVPCLFAEWDSDSNRRFRSKSRPASLFVGCRFTFPGCAYLNNVIV